MLPTVYKNQEHTDNNIVCGVRDKGFGNWHCKEGGSANFEFANTKILNMQQFIFCLNFEKLIFVVV
jgi:hypothetical protein